MTHFALQLAESIDEMAARIDYLERENTHLNKLLAIHQKGEQERGEHHKEMAGMLFEAVFDPNSNLNKTTRIVAKARAVGITD